MHIVLAKPRGFCAGVDMAISCLEQTLKICGAPIYVYHEIVHNRTVVEMFSQRGVHFVDSISDVPSGSYLLYSAHGVSPSIRREAQDRQLKTIDATCPLVTKVHLEAIRFAKEGYHVILVGHAGHDEVIGTMGEAPDHISLVETPGSVDTLPFTANDRLAYVTQTTLSVDEAAEIISALQRRYPQIVSPPREDICYATQNRQEAVRILAPAAELTIVLGSQNSSNSQRLAEIAGQTGGKSILVDNISEVPASLFEGVERVLITAGASAPESLVADAVSYLKQQFQATVEEKTTKEEKVLFGLPKELRNLQQTTPAS